MLLRPRPLLRTAGGYAPALRIYYGGRRWAAPTLASLAAMPAETRRIYAGGVPYICFGTDLKSLLAKFGLGDETSVAAEYGAGGRRVIDDIREGEYLLAWYSVREDDGEPVENATDLKIYGGGFVLDDVSALSCAGRDMLCTPLHCKTPQISEKELLGATFYCAVEPAGGKRLVYYFSREELRSLYPVREMEYPYNDHEIMKKVRCRGVLLADILDSLRGEDGGRLALPGGWRAQYLEEDGYHANTRPTSTARRRARLQAHDDSAGEARAVRISGRIPQRRAVVQRAGQALRLPRRGIGERICGKGADGRSCARRASPLALAECRVRMFDADGGALIAEKTVKGALAGMRAVVAAPPLERYETLEPLSAVVEVGEGACACFRYREKPFFVMTGADGRSKEIFAGKTAGAETIPSSREAVAALAPSGDAAILTGRDGGDFEPKRRLYIDERVYAGGTSPYGYGKYLLYRYEGWKLRELSALLGIEGGAFRAEDEEGASAAIENPDDCFVAFRRTESKGVPTTPRNTSARRRTSAAPCSSAYTTDACSAPESSESLRKCKSPAEVLHTG